MKNITKKDIVDRIADKTGLTNIDAKTITESLLEAIEQSLSKGRNIQIRGFGRFKVVHKKARTARNPRTGELSLPKTPSGIKNEYFSTPSVSLFRHSISRSILFEPINVCYQSNIDINMYCVYYGKIQILLISDL